MNGGLFEGIKKLFCGKDTWKAHLWIISLAFFISAILFYVSTQVTVPEGKQLTEKMIYAYLFKKEPILGVLYVIFTFSISGYFILTINNAIKHIKTFIHNDENAKGVGILPQFSIIEILKILPKLIGLGLVWFIYMGLIFLVLCGGTIKLMASYNSLILNTLALSSILTIAIISSGLLPVIFTQFAENYEVKPLLNPLCTIKILQKTFLPILWLMIKFCGVVMLIGILLILISFINAICLYHIYLGRELTEFIVLFVGYYLIWLISFAFYYSCAFIYCKKLKNIGNEN